MIPEERQLFYRLEEGDKILECDFAIYAQIGYEVSQLTPTLARETGLKERFLGKPWDPTMPEFFRIRPAHRENNP